MFGMGLLSQNGILCYGEWSQNKLFSGIVHNKVLGYIFLGEFSDPKLSKAKGMKIYLQDSTNDVNSELVQEGSFKND